jgi:raffinose/stachyose/melibiose transport system substrate-binding protein
VVSLLVGLFALVSVATAPASSTSGGASGMFTTTDQSAFQILIKNFNNVTPDIKIDPVTYLASSAIDPLILTGLQSGSLPDMWFAHAANGNANGVLPLAVAGKILDLSKGPWVKRLTDFSRPSVAVGKQIFAFPISLFFEGVAYNQDLWNKLGLKVPTNFGQLLTMCDKIKAAGYIPFAQGFGGGAAGFSNWTATLTAMPYVTTPDWNAQRGKGNVHFAGDPRWIQALQMMADMQQRGCFSPGAAGTTVPAAMQQLVNGQAVMSLLASVQTGALQAINPNFTPGWFVFPAVRAQDTRLPVLASAVLVVNKASPNAQNAVDFINFLGRPKQQNLFNKVAGGVSDANVKKCDFQEAIPYLAGFTAMCQKGKLINGFTGTWRNPNMTSYFNAFEQGLITGSTNVYKILQGADYMWDNPTATTPPSG